MKLRDLFSRAASPAGPTRVKTREVDAFADNVLFELKAVIGSAITKALEERESRYMRSILEESYFPLSSLVIRALDGQTARDMESFLAANEEVSPDFRLRFFQQVLQREYRSGRGAMVRVVADLVPTIELGTGMLESRTEDENFIISLKGRRVRFEAQAILEGPLRRQSAPAPEVFPAAHATGAGTAAMGARTSRPTPFAASVSSATAEPRTRVKVRIQDRTGVREQMATLPLIIGRDGQRSALDHGMDVSGIDVEATYVSRRQIVVFELLGDIFCTVPATASLTCTYGNGQVLRPDAMVRLAVGQLLQLQPGVPSDSLVVPTQREHRADYPLIELQAGEPAGIPEDATPRPRAVA